jgi:Tfp pilus assembly pilus retraction ATPase PilT
VEQSLRRNADIIVTGEVRTRDEILAVVNGVLATGKLLMATLHTDNIAVTINRLIRTLKTESEGETKSIIYDLISSLNLIVSQKLLTTVDLNRVAVSEVLHFTKEVKERLHNVEIDQISREVKSIMLEKNDTMVDKAKTLFRMGKITETVYNDFKESFSY